MRFDRKRLEGALAASPRLLHAFGAALAGAAFTGIFEHSISAVSTHLYQYRDDGIITLSHAKNLVDFGHVGVSPSGERLEGYSAPLQFLAYLFVYLCTGAGFEAYINLQTTCATFVMGAVVYTMLKGARLSGGRAFLFTLLAGWLMTGSPTFLLWHYSGMENAITHAMYLGAIAFTAAALEADRYPIALGLVYLGAALTRFESIAHIAMVATPMLLVDLWRRDWRVAKMRSVKPMAIFVVLWCSAFLCRAIYFGDLRPNTAYAQKISVSARFAQFVASPETRTLVLGDMQVFFRAHLGYLYLVAALLVAGLALARPKAAEGKLRRGYWWVAVPLLLVGIGGVHAVALGPARLDAARTVSWLTVGASLSATMAFALCARRQNWALLMPIALVGAIASGVIGRESAYHLCCGGVGIQKIARRFVAINVAEQIHRPTLLISDLGGTSFLKSFNIVDAGFLGSEILAKIQDQSLVANYIFDVAAPDYIEFHSSWSCRYEFLFRDKRWQERYEAVEESRNDWLQRNCSEAPWTRTGYWVRKGVRADSRSEERRFHDAMKSNPSVDKLRDELTRCADRSSRACLYITRTVYRFVPELRRADRLKDVLQVYQEEPESPFRNYSIAWLRSAEDGRLSSKLVESGLAE